MTTAARVIEALADALGATQARVESYALVLRRVGWWSPVKRGRGARPATSNEASKLLLAIMSAGPTDLAGPDSSGFFLDYANLALLPSLRDDPLIAAIRDVLGLDRTAKFLDYLEGLVRLYRDDRTDELIFHSPYPEGFVDDWVWDGPDVGIRVSGPFPAASISFLLSHRFMATLRANGLPEETLMGTKTIPFVSQMLGWHQDAVEKGDEESAEAFVRGLAAVRESTARGVRFERAIGGREVAAVASVLAKPETDG